ncbi:MAG: hypothetical protein CVU57_20890 [Deltaproteobacteria bacterium HGW-Deltaproteobacteria-15]|nr:MAG: hypothetical protein CVU57_20890 [Deltaproteobacteria bacterium HGW-Deltaproteobacteria-15]
MSYPFYGKKFEFTQPDGSRIEVRGWGDQHHAVFESMDGYTVVKDPATGYFCYASLSDDKEELISTGVRVGAVNGASLGLQKGVRINRESARQKALAAPSNIRAKRRWEVRRERAKNFLRMKMMHAGPVPAPPSRETKGNFVGLCLLIQFPDVPGTISREDVEHFCNQQGYTGHGNSGSVYDYFLENSEGLLHYTNVVTPYYTAKNPVSYYSSRQIAHGERARELVKEALAHLITQGFNFLQLTVDDENYVYAVNVFYAGHCPNNWGEGLWPHSWSLSLPYVLPGGAKAYDYQITDLGSELSLATFCHENGHMICDYPDLYDYGYESRGAGVYCLMCAGGRDEKNPTKICAYLKHKSGWSKKLTAISDPIPAQISAEENDFFIYRRNMAEYFIIENRYRSGRDQSLPSSGLAVWHVDELGSNNEEGMTPSHHYECSLEQADNRFDLEKGLNDGDTGDLFSASSQSSFSDWTVPHSKWWDSTPSGLALSNIGPSGKQMTFNIGPSGDGQTQNYIRNSTPKADIPDNNPQGVRDIIHFDEQASITTLKVAVDITHTYRGDLVLTLIAPSGSVVELMARNGGRTADVRQSFDFASKTELQDLKGQFLAGDWVLHVQDLALADQGRLNNWQIEVQGATDKVIDIEDAPGLDIPDNDPGGIERVIETDMSGKVGVITVSVDITHTYIGDLIVTLQSPGGKSVDLHRQEGGSTDNLIMTYDFVNCPSLESLIHEPIAGRWKFLVKDLAGQDRGKLNRWGLRVEREG